MKSTIAKNLTALRTKKKYSKSFVAEKLNTSRSNLTRWERGTMPGVKHLIQLADLYEVSLDYIAGREAQKEGK